jgi:hypothetical protein
MVPLIELAQTEVPSWLSNISDLGIVVFLVVVLFGALRDKPWWVPGATLRGALIDQEKRVDAEKRRADAAEADRDYYRDGLFRALGVSERAVETTRTLAERTLRNESDEEIVKKVEEARRRGLL